MTLREQIQKALGGSFRFALFYKHPGGLRFELSEGGSPLGQVLTALRKATEICNDVFRGEARILVHLEAFARGSRYSFRAMLRELRVAGISIPRVREIWVEQSEDDDDYGAGYWASCGFDVPVAKLQNLLWCAVATDFGQIRPNPQCRVYLHNVQTGLVCHPYDDRGMDIVGRNKSALAELYTRQSQFLFEYDMDVMRQTFERS